MTNRAKNLIQIKRQDQDTLWQQLGWQNGEYNKTKQIQDKQKGRATKAIKKRAKIQRQNLKGLTYHHGPQYQGRLQSGLCKWFIGHKLTTS